MQPGSFWICPLCGGRNKAYAAVCRSCGHGARAEAQRSATLESRSWEPLRLTRAAPRWAVTTGVITATLVSLLIVRTFRTPALDAAQRADENRASQAPTVALAPAASPEPLTVEPAPAAVPTEPSPLATPPAQGFAPSQAPLPTSGRVFTDTDLRTYAAARGRSGLDDARYRFALRRRRVDELRARLQTAGTIEREKLEDWLRSAEADLAEAQQEMAALRGR